MPEGAPEHRALVMLMDLNAEQHRQLSQLAATVTGLQKDLAALKAPEAREQRVLRDTCMDVVEWLYRMGDDEADRVALAFKYTKDDASEISEVSRCGSEVTGAWMEMRVKCSPHATILGPRPSTTEGRELPHLCQMGEQRGV